MTVTTALTLKTEHENFSIKIEVNGSERAIFIKNKDYGSVPHAPKYLQVLTISKKSFQFNEYFLVQRGIDNNQSYKKNLESLSGFFEALVIEIQRKKNPLTKDLSNSLIENLALEEKEKSKNFISLLLRHKNISKYEFTELIKDEFFQEQIKSIDEKWMHYLQKNISNNEVLLQKSAKEVVEFLARLTQNGSVNDLKIIKNLAETNDSISLVQANIFFESNITTKNRTPIFARYQNIIAPVLNTKSLNTNTLFSILTTLAHEVSEHEIKTKLKDLFINLKSQNPNGIDASTIYNLLVDINQINHLNQHEVMTVISACQKHNIIVSNFLNVTSLIKNHDIPDYLQSDALLSSFKKAGFTDAKQIIDFYKLYDEPTRDKYIQCFKSYKSKYLVEELTIISSNRHFLHKHLKTDKVSERRSLLAEFTEFGHDTMILSILTTPDLDHLYSYLTAIYGNLDTSNRKDFFIKLHNKNYSFDLEKYLKYASNTPVKTIKKNATSLSLIAQDIGIYSDDFKQHHYNKAAKMSDNTEENLSDIEFRTTLKKLIKIMPDISCGEWIYLLASSNNKTIQYLGKELLKNSSFDAEIFTHLCWEFSESNKIITEQEVKNAIKNIKQINDISVLKNYVFFNDILVNNQAFQKFNRLYKDFDFSLFQKLKMHQLMAPILTIDFILKPEIKTLIKSLIDFTERKDKQQDLIFSMIGFVIGKIKDSPNTDKNILWLSQHMEALVDKSITLIHFYEKICTHLNIPTLPLTQVNLNYRGARNNHGFIKKKIQNSEEKTLDIKMEPITKTIKKIQDWQSLPEFRTITMVQMNVIPESKKMKPRVRENYQVKIGRNLHELKLEANPNNVIAVFTILKFLESKKSPFQQFYPLKDRHVFHVSHNENKGKYTVGSGTSSLLMFNKNNDYTFGNQQLQADMKQQVGEKGSYFHVRELESNNTKAGHDAFKKHCFTQTEPISFIFDGHGSREGGYVNGNGELGRSGYFSPKFLAETLIQRAKKLAIKGIDERSLAKAPVLIIDHCKPGEAIDDLMDKIIADIDATLKNLADYNKKNKKSPVPIPTVIIPANRGAQETFALPLSKHNSQFFSYSLNVDQKKPINMAQIMHRESRVGWKNTSNLTAVGMLPGITIEKGNINLESTMKKLKDPEFLNKPYIGTTPFYFSEQTNNNSQTDV